MTDVHDKITRSRNMAAIRSQKTRPESRVAELVEGVGFQAYVPGKEEYFGNPDLVILPPQSKPVCVFVHGCFWHGHSCPEFKIPSSNRRFWHEKIMSNQIRDECVKNYYDKQSRMRYLVVWECALRGAFRLHQNYISGILKVWLDGSESYLEIAPH